MASSRAPMRCGGRARAMNAAPRKANAVEIVGGGAHQSPEGGEGSLAGLQVPRRARPFTLPKAFAVAKAQTIHYPKLHPNVVDSPRPEV